MFRIAVDNDVRCAVYDLNKSENRTIVFVHGWPLSKEIFEPQYNVLTQYGIRCIGIDLRGFGQSDRPAGGYTYDRMADDLFCVLSRLDCRCVTLCGFSMGGAVCIRYMARHAGYKVGRLVLMGAAAPSFVQRAGYPYGMTVAQVDSLIADAYNNRPKMCEAFGRLCFANPPGPEFMRWFSDIAFEAAGWATIHTAEALRDEDLRRDLGKIKVPTAIFHGVRDCVCPFAFAEELKKGIPASFIVPFQNSGHCLFYEERDKCNGELVNFISG